MLGKVAAAGVSLILVVGVVIGVIASVGHFGHKNGNSTSGTNEDTHLSAGMKAVTTICSPTEYKDTCIKTLSPVANNGSVNPKDLVKAAIQFTMDEVQKAIEHSEKLIDDPKLVNNNATLKEALEDCKAYLGYAIDDLQDSVSMVVDNELHTLGDLAPELQNWLSAVISFKETCLDGLDINPELKNAMLNNGGITNVTEFTTNALGIVGEISEILKTFNIPLNLTSASTTRRLLAESTDEEGFPTWFSGKDRKLLGMHKSGRLQPNAVVAQDGTGQFKTIAAALAAYPKKNEINQRYVIYVKAGIYDEYITITKDQHNIFMYGDGPTKSIVTGRKNTGLDGIKTDKSASFAVIGRDFVCISMGFRNTAGPEGHQAVALRVQSDRSAFFNCRMDGYQDTLYVQAHRQFYRNCIVSGTVDFIFGDSSTLIQNSMIIVRKPMEGQKNTVTAHGRSKASETTGLVIQNSQIVPERELFPLRFKMESYLGRPWKEYSRTIFMECAIGDFIHPDGWYPWAGDFALNTLDYGEYANTGPGANIARRVKWKGFHVITNRAEAMKYTAAAFFRGQYWLKSTGVPFMLGLTH